MVLRILIRESVEGGMNGGLRKLNRYLLAGAGVIALLATGAPEAKAQDLQQIQAQIEQMQATIKALQKQVEEAKAQAAAAKSAAANSGGPSDIDLQVKWKGAPELSSKDGKFKMKVRGRLEVDYNKADQDTRITSFPDVAATELRRARLGVEGILWYDWKYVFEIDFANDVVRVKDAYLQYQGFRLADNPVLLRIGNFKTFNTFQDETSDRFVDNMERAAFINAWDIDRQIGFGTMYYAKHFGLAGGVFGERAPSNQDQSLFPGFTGDEDLTLAARGFVAPINRETNGVPQVLHFGASVRNREAGDDQPLFQYGNNARGADLHLTNAPVLTGRIGDEDTFWGVEGATLWGPFAFQGEYGQLDVNLPGGAFVRSNPPGAGRLASATNPFIGIPDPTFTGWYIEGSWFFGGHKTYEEDGRWGRPVVYHPMFHGSGGWGALQVIGSFDVLDMSDNEFNDAGGCRTTRLFPGSVPNSANNQKNSNSIPLCGEMQTWKIGMNWYMTEYMRLMFQYSESDLSQYPFFVPQNPKLPPGKNNGFDDATIKGFGMRMQVDW
jgi:phosphate-selective porin OprO and OprP